MKKDWEIIRAVLLELESAPRANTNLGPKHLPQYPEQEVAYNLRLLDEAGYIKGKFVDSSDGDGRIAAAIATRLTNEGHELLDTIRNDNVWTKLKETFRSKGLDMTFELAIEVGKTVIKSFLGLQ